MVDVAKWLVELGLEQYVDAFAKNAVDEELLCSLTGEDLKEIGVTPLGHRKKLLSSISSLRDALQSSSPKGATSSLSVAPERRQLTVLFCDLADSTELSAKLDPEDLREVISSYQDACANVVSRFDGHIARFLGDGVLAYFGWPVAHEDDAERAVRTGLALVETVAHLKFKVDVHLQSRVGIATGPVIVGDLIGKESTDVDSVIGETPNLAARLQALTQPGALVISQATHRLVHGLFAFDDLGPQELKGFAKPLGAWRVLRELQVQDRFAARHPGGFTPLVNREEEISLLRRRWQQIKDDEGQVVLLSGEPGIGKSRLLREFRGRLEGEPYISLFYQCSPYYTSSPLRPLIEQLERAAGLERDDSSETKLVKLEELLGRGTQDLDQAVPLIAALLGITSAPRYTLPEHTPQRQKQLTLRAAVDQLDGLSRDRPVLMVYEDAHWIDPTTLELLGLAIERIQHLRVLFVVTSRPQFIPPWTGLPQVSTLTLTRLGRREGAAMLQELAGAKTLPAEVSAQILGKTDGVPLFVEELTKQVLESGILTDVGNRYELAKPLPPLAIPTTLQDSLLARLDRLAPVKAIAQVGAAIGREFSHSLLLAVADRPEKEVASAVEQLISSELIFRRGSPPEASYVFKHALVRDTAYDSLLKSQRHQLHGRIAMALERLWPEINDVQPELLAYHYSRAGLPEQAADCWRAAAERAIRRFANLEAISHCDEAIAELRLVTRSIEQVRTELEVQLLKGVAVRAGRGYSVPESEHVYRRASELCAELDDQFRLVHALRGLFGYYYVAARWQDAAEVADRIVLAAEGLEDQVVQSIRWTMDGASRLFRGQPSEAVVRLQEGLRYYDEVDRETHIRLTGHEMASLICFHLAIAQLMVGLPESAVGNTEKAVQIAREAMQPFSLAQALGNSALAQMLLGDWTKAQLLAEETLEISAQHRIPDYVSFAGALVGVAIAARGDVGRGEMLVHQGLEGLNKAGWHCFVPILQVQLAEILRENGETDRALEIASKALRLTRASGELLWEAEALRVQTSARYALLHREDELEEDLLAAIAIAKHQKAKIFELRAILSLVRFRSGRGRKQKSRELLLPIYGQFTEGFSTRDLCEARDLLKEAGS